MVFYPRRNFVVPDQRFLRFITNNKNVDAKSSIIIQNIRNDTI